MSKKKIQGRGAKSKLNKKFIERAEELLEKGNYAVTVCNYLGISQASWYSWLEQGRAMEKAGEQGLHLEFMEAVKRAEAQAEIKNVEVIQKASVTQWQASAWYLERKFNEKWGRKEQLTADMNHGGKVDLNHRMEKMTDEELKALADSFDLDE